MPVKKRFMNVFCIMLLILLAIPAINAQNESDRWPYYSQFVDVDITIESGITVLKTRPDSVMDLAIANVTFVPVDTGRQKVLMFDSIPMPTTHAYTLEYIWHKPMTNELDFTITSRMRGYNTYTKIPNKVSYPIVNLPPEIIPYTQPSPNINSEDESIRDVATELAHGEDDLYVIVHKTALWTKQNINYSLSTITADVSQPASWVMQNREGVCDELTSLFIAMLRSLGIPARFISGIAYTDMPEFPQQWGGHGWAEVYFPGYGWADWDVTYGEFGAIDPTHIKLKESLDSDEPATVYVWQGRGVEATAKEMTLSGGLVNKFGKIPPRISLESFVMYKSVGIGSYNLVQAEVTNLEDSYLSTTVSLAPTDQISTVSEQSQIIYLEPREMKRLFWIVKVDGNLDDDYIYTFPTALVTFMNVTSRTSFVAMKSESMFSKEQMQQVIDANERERKSKSTSMLSILCSADQPYYYGYDVPKITCGVKNIGNTKLLGVNVCLEMQCGKTDLRINQEKMFDYTVDTLNYGTNQLMLTAGNNEISKSFIFDILVLDNPKISVREISAPSNVTYKENFTISFLLERLSSSRPQNVTILFTNGGVDEYWFITSMENDQRYNVDMTGALLHEGNNTFNVQLNFTDLNGRSYATIESFQIELTGLTLWQKIALFVRDVDQKLRKLFE